MKLFKYIGTLVRTISIESKIDNALFNCQSFLSKEKDDRLINQLLELERSLYWSKDSLNKIRDIARSEIK
jgi:hypothetical protein